MAARELTVPATPDDVLRGAALALRRLGARVVRYDVAAGTLEARAGRRLVPVVVTLCVRPVGEASRVTIRSDTRDWRALVRQLAAELAASRWP